MDVINVLLIGATSVNLALAAVVYVHRERDNPMNITFSAVVANIAIWSVVMILFRASSGPYLDFLLRALYAVPLFMPVIFLHFAYSFTQSSVFQNVKPYAVALYAYTTIFALTIFTSNLVVFDPVAFVGRETSFSFGPAYLLYVMHYLIIFPLAFALIAYAYNTSSDELYRRRLILLFFGVGLSAIVGLIGNLLLPWFNIFAFDWSANLITVLYVCVVMYAIIKYSLFSLKVIATELISLLLIGALLVEVFSAKTAGELYLKIGVLALVSVLITFLIKSVYREVEQRKEIQKLSDEKSEFMTFASHEIRNPITALRGYASLLLEGDMGDVPPRVKETAEKMLVIGNDVLSLISQFLNRSKLELGQIQFETAKVDLNAAALAVAGGFKPNAEMKGLKLEINISSGGAVFVHADEPKLKEVIGNLIDNSIKYTKQGSVTIATAEKEGKVRLTISDTGAGIKPDVLPKLFQKFSRADAAKANLLGTGVGLYLAKTFIEAMGGKIWAESDGENKGSRFILEFPRA